MEATLIMQPENLLTKTQSALKSHGLDAILVRSTDPYFNEYVPHKKSIRANLTGFKGSAGDALIFKDQAILFVDGRYTLQAAEQAPQFKIITTNANESIESSWLNFLKTSLSANSKLAYDPKTLGLTLFKKLEGACLERNITLSSSAQDIFDQVTQTRDDQNQKTNYWQAPLSTTGLSCAQKIAQLKPFMEKNNADGIFLVKLDDIAWLTNIRSNFFDFQVTFPAIACVLKNKIILECHTNQLRALNDLPSEIEIVEKNQMVKSIKQELGKKECTIMIDESEASKDHLLTLQGEKFAIVSASNPVRELKAIKNEKELLHMRSAFKKADHVLYQTQKFCEQTYDAQKELSEGEIDDFVQETFAKSKAQGLSFRPICGSGKNGAIIHYGTPNRSEKIAAGSLFLLDTGAYYEGGYATDLTRTFLIGPKTQEPKTWQKTMFTLVLKASIAGLSAKFKKGFTGKQLDALVRAPLWQSGLDFAHGTGHGVGINVHEFPPRVAAVSDTELKVGQVFSIEPGLYFENLGGVRIENLVCVEQDKRDQDYLVILPLTFSPLDNRLIDRQMLNEFELSFLNYFEKEWQSTKEWPAPLQRKTFHFSEQK